MILFVFVVVVFLKFFMLGVSMEYSVLGWCWMWVIMLVLLVIVGIYLGDMNDVVFIFMKFVLDSWFISLILVLVEIGVFLF